MKRLFSTFCLLVGASVASYAGVITGGSGLSGTASALLGPSAALLDFGTAATFPANSFTSLPQTFSNGVNVTIRSGTVGSPGPAFAIQDGTGFQPFFGPGIASNVLNTYNGGSFSNTTSFVKSLTFDFGSNTVSGFSFDYFAVDSTVTFLVNGIAQAANSIQSAQGGGVNSGRAVAFVADGTIPTISTITLVLNGSDNGQLGGLGESVLIDNVRITAGTVGSSSSPGSSSSSGGGQGAVPEPSTYALMGAGLLALSYARRKK